MTHRETILEILKNSDRPVSGEELSALLSVSRTAVWKEIEALRKLGYEIDSAPRRGYRLLSSPDRLTESEIRPYLSGCRLGQNLLCFESIDSTNTELKRQLLSGATGELVAIADEQTGGRGKSGGSFPSLKGLGLYLSALMFPEISTAETAEFTAKIAASVCDAIEEVCGIRPEIRGTNDLLIAEKKVCGILTEVEIEAETDTVRNVIAGIGIYCHHTEKDFAENVRAERASLDSFLETPVSRAKLAGTLIRHLEMIYQTTLEKR